MRRRLLVILSIALVVGALTVPARAAVGPTTVIQVGCDFATVTADAVVTPGGLTRGFASFHGAGCADVGLIFYFEGSGSTWTRAQSPLRGRVLAAADDGSSTFLLYQSSSGVWVAKRPHSGGLVNVQRVSTNPGGITLTTGDLVAFTDQWWAVWTEQVGAGEFAPVKLFQSKTIGAGDCIDPITKQQITINPSLDDQHPSIVLKPASAGASAAELFFHRTNGAQGTSGHIWRGSAGCDAHWSFRQLSFAGQIDLNPDASRSGVGNNHVTFERDGDHIVYLNNSSGTYRGRQFATPGAEPRVTTSQGVVFVAFRDFRQHPFVAIFRAGAWSGRDLTPGAGGQLVLAVTATGGRGTVLAASFSSHRLYAVADL
jgi:hypothetical protein